MKTITDDNHIENPLDEGWRFCDVCGQSEREEYVQVEDDGFTMCENCVNTTVPTCRKCVAIVLDNKAGECPNCGEVITYEPNISGC